MTEAEQFYLERDSRTALCLGGRSINQVPIQVLLDAKAASAPAGQAAALALINQLSRVHRRIIISLSDTSTPLLVRALFPGINFTETLLHTARLIDPYGHVEIQTSSPSDTAMSIGIGESLPPTLTWYIGAAGALAFLDHAPCALDISQPATLRGAALASCLGAAAVFRSALGHPTAPRTLSCWNYQEGKAADPGPPELPPLDIGTTLIVGVGGVGSALIHWLHLLGASGTWILVDRDRVELNNTNRQLLFVPADAGWKNSHSAYKVHVAFHFLPNCQAFTDWYHECDAIKNFKFDVILALANEHDARTRLAQRNPAVMLHATTGENWLSELHRHILGTDDCIRCRMADIRTARLACSTSTSRQPKARMCRMPRCRLSRPPAVSCSRRPCKSSSMATFTTALQTTGAGTLIPHTK